jgi:hypothetical protein
MIMFKPQLTSRSGHARTLAMAGVAFAVVVVTVGAPSWAALDQGPERAATAYLNAILSGDRTALMQLSPMKAENKFGPCPFAEMPRIDSARVDAHRAAVLFKGKTKDRDLPGEGAIMLTLLDHVKVDPWRVRQVGFFTRAPLGAKLPKRSITGKDKAQEPLVLRTAKRYVAAWMRGDYRTMEALAFDWVAAVDEPARGVRLRNVELQAKPTGNGETRINFTAKVTLFRVLPKTLEGTLFAMREEDQWKIRSTELTF